PPNHRPPYHTRKNGAPDLSGAPSLYRIRKKLRLSLPPPEAHRRRAGQARAEQCDGDRFRHSGHRRGEAGAELGDIAAQGGAAAQIGAVEIAGHRDVGEIEADDIGVAGDAEEAGAVIDIEAELRAATGAEIDLIAGARAQTIAAAGRRVGMGDAVY